MPQLIDSGTADAHGVGIRWEVFAGGPASGARPVRRFAARGRAADVVWRVQAGELRAPAGPSTAFFGDLRLHCLGAGDLVLVGPGAGATLSADGREVRVCGTDEAQCLLTATLMLHFVMHRHGLFHVHAAGLTLANGRGVLVVGGSGSGKTTTALSLLADDHDARWASDDAIYLRSTEDGVEGCGLPGPFNLTEQTLECFPSIRAWDRGPAEGTTPKRAVDPRESHRGREQSPTGPIRLLAFPRIHDSAETRGEPLEGPRAYATLLESSAIALLQTPGFEQHLEALMSLVRSARAVTLLLGRDALLDPKRPGALLRLEVERA